ncbi:MAG: LysR family transcriptional regulator [Nannocystaceae bacterium]
MDLRNVAPKMLVFSRVAELGSFTAAARDLNMSRPSVSSAVAQLEASLGVQLLHRSTRNVRATEAGIEFLDACVRLRTHASEAIEQVRALSEAPVGTLRVTSPGGAIAQRLVAPALARLYSEHGVRAELQCADRVLGVVAGGFDAAVRVGVPKRHGLVMRRLGRTRQMLVASPALADSITAVEDLESAPWVCHESLAREFTLQGPRKSQSRVRMRPHLLVDDSSAMLGVLVSGAGIGLAAELVLAPEIRSGVLVELLPKWQAPSVDIFVLMPSRRPPKRVRLLIDALREAI